MHPRRRRYLDGMWKSLEKAKKQIPQDHALNFDLYKASQSIQYNAGVITETELVTNLYQKAIKSLKQ